MYNNEENRTAMKLYQLWSDHTYRAFETKEKMDIRLFALKENP